jgi:hemerythrin-like metal-binding protein
MGLVWRESMCTGNAAVDADHKMLLNLVNATEKYKDDWNPVLIGEILKRLKKYFEEHFAREEALMKSIGYKDFDVHVEDHRKFTNKTLLIHRRFFSSEDIDTKKLCATILHNLLIEKLADHVLKEDLKLKPYLKDSVGSGVVWSASREESVSRERKRRNQDIEYSLPPELSHLLQRLETIVIPELPPPQADFADFDALCEAAIWDRINRVLVFFHRHNSALDRELPPIFICSPEFAEKFRVVVDRFIFPVIRDSRQVKLLSTNFDWSSIDIKSFWDHITPLLKQAILFSWNEAWDALRLVPAKKADGTGVLQITEQTKQLREMLQPSEPGAYDLPRVGNRDIETFKSFLDTSTDWWPQLNSAWDICYDIYEQEKDPRIFQQKAREGALRDNLLAAFEKLPEKWGDFIALLCHRAFPRVSTLFLEKFTTNFGPNAAAREPYVPYTMHYLNQARQHPEMRARELREEETWQAQAKQLRDFLSGRKAAAAADQQLVANNPAAEFQKTILVVDDIDYMRKQIGHILRGAGFANVVEANEGGRAFETLCAAPEVYGLVISDFDMAPTNGLHLLTVLRKDEMTPEVIRNVPFIMLSSSAAPAHAAEIRKAGANGMVIKPFNGATLADTVLKVIGH